MNEQNVNQIEDIKKLKEIINTNRISSIKDKEMIEWYNILSEQIGTLKKRHKIFSVGSTIRHLLFFTFLILFNSTIIGLKHILGIYEGNIFDIVISLFIWSVFLLLYIYFSDYTGFISKVTEKEMTRIRMELLYLLSTQEKVTMECLQRNLFSLYKKDIEKILMHNQKLLNKLYETEYQKDNMV